MSRTKDSRQFVVKGPYSLPFNEKGKLDNPEIKQFFAGAPGGFASKHGVYVFAVKHGKAYMPYYVGKTKNSFKAEIFNFANLRKFEGVYEERKGTPVIFLIVPSDELKLPSGQVKNVSKGRAAIITEIEEFFIKLAACVNPKLLNKQKAKGPKWTIKSLLNADQGRPDKETTAFKSMFKAVDWTWMPSKDKVAR